MKYFQVRMTTEFVIKTCCEERLKEIIKEFEDGEYDILIDDIETLAVTDFKIKEFLQ